MHGHRPDARSAQPSNIPAHLVALAGRVRRAELAEPGGNVQVQLLAAVQAGVIDWHSAPYLRQTND